jgi:hypothetical protein
MNEQAVRDLRWLLWAIDPVAYAKHHADQLLEHLHCQPKEVPTEDLCQE